LWAAIAVNLGALALFKYADFLTRDLDTVLRMVGGPHLGMKRGQIALPLGISFFTFHALSYLIDVYRRRFEANRSLNQIALYIAFFPQLIAGPIVRYRTIARRLAFRRHSWGRASAGLRLAVTGLAMKTLIADPLAPVADAVFDHAAQPGLLAAWAGTAAYTLQIYFDFAGYSLMAIGMGVVFGFSLPRNFDRPYRSGSITEFWRRWHMTLSAWFRDYLYIPLGGNRGGAVRTYRNLVVVFLLCGLWHGASWTFVLWGLWHGLFLVLERAGLGPVLKRLPAVVGWAYALFAVMLGWVLFRAPSLIAAVQVWRGLAGLNGNALALGPDLARVWARGLPALMAIGFLLAVLRLRPMRWLPQVVGARLAGLIDGAAVCALLALCILAAAGGGYSPFLYYRF
ncbi:MAG TPA: MBOAT family O-acyltransferase, partial [Caulobacteraceae bacterium]